MPMHLVFRPTSVGIPKQIGSFDPTNQTSPGRAKIKITKFTFLLSYGIFTQKMVKMVKIDLAVFRKLKM